MNKTMFLKHIRNKSALKFVIMLGFISFFTDMATCGARSIIGPYFATLGTSATVVGFISGLGELIGYSLRLIAGYFADKTKKYWLIIIIGHALSLSAVALLALGRCWQFVGALIIFERIGKAVRTPSRDALLSYQGHIIGKGKTFGIHKMLDQIGAMLGPVIIMIVLLFKFSYRESFLFLIAPSFLAIIILIVTKESFPIQSDKQSLTIQKNWGKFSLSFLLFSVGAGSLAAGYADFSLIAFHLQKAAIITSFWIPFYCAISMCSSAVSAYIFGNLYDKNGVAIFIFTIIISSLFSPLSFLGGKFLALIGIILWGMGLGTQLSLMRATVAKKTPANKRGYAYGVFNAVYGIAWFLGSCIMGILYDHSILGLVAFSLTLQFIAIPFFILANKI